MCFSCSVVFLDLHQGARSGSTRASSPRPFSTTAATSGATAEPMMMHSSSLVAVNGNDAVNLGSSVDGATSATNSLVPDAPGSNGNTGSSLSISAAAAAPPPVAYNLDSPEEMDGVEPT